MNRILIYKDPHSSGLSVIHLKPKDDLIKILAKKGIDEDSCGGEVVPYALIQGDNLVVFEDSLDFT